MKSKIHPKYNTKVKAKCACGAKYEVGSTMESIEVERCSQCHPFYTGKDKLIDTAGRVEKFKQRRAAAEAAVKTVKASKPKEDKQSKEKTEEVATAKPEQSSVHDTAKA